MVNIRGERPPEANVVGTSSWKSSSEAEEKRRWGRVGRARDGAGNPRGLLERGQKANNLV